MDATPFAALLETLASGTPKDKCRAAHEIGELGQAAASAIPALVTALADPSHEDEESMDGACPTGHFYSVHIVAQAAARALAALGETARDALPALKSMLASKSMESEARASAAAAIGRIAAPSPQLREELLALLVDAHDKGPVATLLLDLFPGDPATATSVAKYLNEVSYGREQLALACRLAYAQVRPQEVVPVLVGLLGAGNLNGRDDMVRILRAIRAFGTATKLSSDDLLKVLTQVNPLDRREVVELLTRIGAVPALLQLRDLLGGTWREVVEKIDALVAEVQQA